MLIGLLNKQKQAIIHQAVTRGLNPDIPLKPSGIPWLGDMPAHWELSRVKNEFACLNPRRVPLSSVQRGAMTAKTYDYYGASGVIDKVDDFLFDDELLLIAEDGANLVLRNLRSGRARPCLDEHDAFRSRRGGRGRDLRG